MALKRPSLKRTLLLGTSSVLVGGGLLVVAGVFYVRSVYNSALSAECSNRPVVDLGMDEVISLRKRRRAYSRSRDASDVFEVSGREASFILAGELDMGVWVEVREDRLVAHLTVPDPQGCYNIEYVGGIDVAEGSLRLVPDSLVVGEADFTSWFRLLDSVWGIDPVAHTAFEERVANIERLEVVNGRIRLQYRDRKVAW